MRPTTRFVLCLCLLIGSGGASRAQTLSPTQAIAQIGKPDVVVEMQVKKSKDRLVKRGIIFLDSNEDFTSDDNLGVAISAGAAEKFQAAGIADPAAHYLNKTIQVRGCVMQFEDRPYLPVLDPAQITIVQSVATTPVTSPSDARHRPLIVSVAASTTDAANKLAKSFHAKTGIEIKVNPGPSNGLATQILAGAPADLFLSASQQWADKVIDEGLATADVELLTNRLVIVVPKGNPARIKSPHDLMKPAVKALALAGESVPAGQYADQALTRLGLLEQLTNERRIARGQDVRAALAYVEHGEAEAGIVYATDAAIAPDVEVAYQFDPTLHEQIVYVLVLLKSDDDKSAARQFYDFLQSDEAEKVFAELGFAPLR
jgi:molybdate transport system substrate-binding protein